MTNSNNSSYIITHSDNILTIGFNPEMPASNDQIVKDAESRLNEITLKGGELLKINGPASLPVACVIAHKVNHLYGAIGVYDPKLNKYVIAISHSPKYKLGDLVD